MDLKNNSKNAFSNACRLVCTVDFHGHFVNKLQHAAFLFDANQLAHSADFRANLNWVHEPHFVPAVVDTQLNTVQCRQTDACATRQKSHNRQR